MYRFKAVWMLPLFAVTLSGCVIAINSDDAEENSRAWKDRQHRNEAAINRLQIGQAIHGVTDDLGDADFTESFWRDGSEFTVLYYRTRRLQTDGRTTRDETTPLVFVGGELVGWGESAIANATRIAR